MIKKVFFLPAGRCQVDASILDTRIIPGSRTIDLPVWVYLIETTDGPVLIDTGMPASCISNPLGLFEGSAGSIVPKMKREDSILRILERKGYRPQDLICLVSSHLHFDHAGGNECFPDTEIVVQEKEYRAAMEYPGYPEACRNPKLSYKLIHGDTELMPGIQLLYTPGHSPGHQSILIQALETGNLLLTIDAAYCRDNYEEGVPFAVHNQTDADASIIKLKEIAKSEKAKVFFGHDIMQEKEWSKSLVLI